MVEITLQFRVTLREPEQKELAVLAERGETFAKTLSRETMEFWRVNRLASDIFEPKMVIDVL